MQTVKEAAKENAEKYWVSDSRYKSSIASFNAGVEFAQKWIPVVEEKPTKQGHYLVIAPQSFPKNCKVVVAEFYEDNQMFYSESSDCPLPDVTHWRLIEYPIL